MIDLQSQIADYDKRERLVLPGEKKRSRWLYVLTAIASVVVILGFFAIFTWSIDLDNQICIERGY